MKGLIERATRFLFFTGKGGVGKTSLACATSIALADSGKRILLVSTDPASNLDEVLETKLSSEPLPVRNVAGLDAMNIDPLQAARVYRERIVGPIRGVLPDATVKNIEEQLSGACTTEIASFNEFSQMLGDSSRVEGYDHVVLDTAPTGHTLRLLALPAAWSDFIAENKSGSTCLGPLSGLKDQKEICERAMATLSDGEQTALVLVARADVSSLREAARASVELKSLGVGNQKLILNALFHPTIPHDRVAQAIESRSNAALDSIPVNLMRLPQYRAPFRCNGLTGVDRLRDIFSGKDETVTGTFSEETAGAYPGLDGLVADMAAEGKGVIMTMGKGGVGKTSLAKRIARSLAQAGHAVHLSTTDPADHVTDLDEAGLPSLTVSSIDPKKVTREHVANTLAEAGAGLDEAGRALLEEELRSPCTEEIAVFTAFAREIARGEEQFVVLDTAPTGHTLLLLDATEAYHREVLKSAHALPQEVGSLLPRLRDARHTKTIVVALPEATPVHEAAQLQDDLRRAGIEPYAWVVNQCISATDTKEPLLLAKGAQEKVFIEEVASQHAKRWVVEPWSTSNTYEPVEALH